MGANTAPQQPTAVPGETNNLAVSFVGKLDSGETLTGTPTVVEQATNDLTITNKAVSVAELVIQGQTVPVGMAVQARVSGQLAAHSPYRLVITVATTAGQIKKAYVSFRVAAE